MRRQHMWQTAGAHHFGDDVRRNVAFWRRCAAQVRTAFATINATFFRRNAALLRRYAAQARSVFATIVSRTRSMLRDADETNPSRRLLACAASAAARSTPALARRRGRSDAPPLLAVRTPSHRAASRSVHCRERITKICSCEGHASGTRSILQYTLHCKDPYIVKILGVLLFAAGESIALSGRGVGCA